MELTQFYMFIHCAHYRFTFVIPPVEAPPISMHSCHPPPSLSHKQATFTSKLTTEVAPLIRSLHHIHCSMRTQFPDLRLIEYDCGKMLLPLIAYEYFRFTQCVGQTSGALNCKFKSIFKNLFDLFQIILHI